MPFSNTISPGHAVPETSDQGGKDGRPLVCNRVLQPSFAPVSNAISSCPPVPGTYVSDQNTTSWQFISPYSQIQPGNGFIAPEAPHLIPNYPCPQRESQQVKENAQPKYPQRPKPPPGILVLARLAFLDSKVTRCYGCGNSLKPEGTTPHPPDDLVLTTRLRRQYYKEGRQHTSPDISSVYYHVNPYCIK